MRVSIYPGHPDFKPRYSNWLRVTLEGAPVKARVADDVAGTIDVLRRDENGKAVLDEDGHMVIDTLTGAVVIALRDAAPLGARQAWEADGGE